MTLTLKERARCLKRDIPVAFLPYSPAFSEGRFGIIGAFGHEICQMRQNILSFLLYLTKYATYVKFYLEKKAKLLYNHRQ